jgi:hypothetical protein
MPKRTREYRDGLLRSLRDSELARLYITAAALDSFKMYRIACKDVADALRMKGSEMPRIYGRGPKVLPGEHNPRHYIMIPVGTGNQYCCNCDHIINSSDKKQYCGVFFMPGTYQGITLGGNPRLGPERCTQCRAAEKTLVDAKEACRHEGENTSFYKATDGASCVKSSLSGRTMPDSR